MGVVVPFDLLDDFRRISHLGNPACTPLHGSDRSGLVVGHCKGGTQSDKLNREGSLCFGTMPSCKETRDGFGKGGRRGTYNRSGRGKDEIRAALPSPTRATQASREANSGGCVREAMYAWSVTMIGGDWR